MEDKVEMFEEYDKEGVCIRRTVNGHELPADTEPSIQIFKDCNSVTQKFYISKEQYENIYGRQNTKGENKRR